MSARPARSARPHHSEPGRAEWEAATEQPGRLVFRDEEPTGDQSGNWGC